MLLVEPVFWSNFELVKPSGAWLRLFSPLALLARGLYYKTFYGRNLQIFAISYSVCPWQALLA
jgi:hypothetical protein